MTLNDEVAKQTINDIGANLPGIMTESSYSIEGNKLIITKGKEGVIIDTEKLLEQVKENLNNIEQNQNILEIPVNTQTPQEINIEKILKKYIKIKRCILYKKSVYSLSRSEGSRF